MESEELVIQEQQELLISPLQPRVETTTPVHIDQAEHLRSEEVITTTAQTTEVRIDKSKATEVRQDVLAMSEANLLPTLTDERVKTIETREFALKTGILESEQAEIHDVSVTFAVPEVFPEFPKRLQPQIETAERHLVTVSKPIMIRPAEMIVIVEVLTSEQRFDATAIVLCEDFIRSAPVHYYQPLKVSHKNLTETVESEVVEILEVREEIVEEEEASVSLKAEVEVKLTKVEDTVTIVEVEVLRSEEIFETVANVITSPLSEAQLSIVKQLVEEILVEREVVDVELSLVEAKEKEEKSYSAGSVAEVSLESVEAIQHRIVPQVETIERHLVKVTGPAEIFPAKTIVEVEVIRSEEMFNAIGLVSQPEVSYAPDLNINKLELTMECTEATAQAEVIVLETSSSEITSTTKPFTEQLATVIIEASQTEEKCQTVAVVAQGHYEAGEKDLAYILNDVCAEVEVLSLEEAFESIAVVTVGERRPSDRLWSLAESATATESLAVVQEHFESDEVAEIEIDECQEASASLSLVISDVFEETTASLTATFFAQGKCFEQVWCTVPLKAESAATLIIKCSTSFIETVTVDVAVVRMPEKEEQIAFVALICLEAATFARKLEVLESTSVTIEHKAFSELTTVAIIEAPDYVAVRGIVERVDQSDISTSATELPLQPPRFLQPLRDTKTTEGQMVRLKGIISGFPTPEVNWYVDGDKITSSRYPNN